MAKHWLEDAIGDNLTADGIAKAITFSSTFLKIVKTAADVNGGDIGQRLDGYGSVAHHAADRRGLETKQRSGKAFVASQG